MTIIIAACVIWLLCSNKCNKWGYLSWTLLQHHIVSLQRLRRTADVGYHADGKEPCAMTVRFMRAKFGEVNGRIIRKLESLCVGHRGHYSSLIGGDVAKEKALDCGVFQHRRVGSKGARETGGGRGCTVMKARHAIESSLCGSLGFI